jgi:c(7)-type cytochrome triheme protein
MLLLALPMHQVLAARGDTVMFRGKNEGGEYPPATFPHSVHRYQYKCYACHDGIFKMKKGDAKMTMDDIGQGKFCGACHNETIAFGSNFESCERCHR